MKTAGLTRDTATRDEDGRFGQRYSYDTAMVRDTAMRGEDGMFGQEYNYER